MSSRRRPKQASTTATSSSSIGRSCRLTATSSWHRVDGDFTVKFLHSRYGRVKLVPANPIFPETTFKDGQTLTICGVVTCTIKRFV